MNDRLPDPRMIPPWRPAAQYDAPPDASGRPQAVPRDYDDVPVRPFMLTGGRTRPVRDGLRIETLLRALPAALSAPLRFEARRIVAAAA